MSKNTNIKKDERYQFVDSVGKLFFQCESTNSKDAIHELKEMGILADVSVDECNKKLKLVIDDIPIENIKFNLEDFVLFKEENLSKFAYFNIDKKELLNCFDDDLFYGATIGFNKDGLFWIDLNKDIESESVTNFIEKYFEKPIQVYLKIKKLMQ